jgi:hypothetical protein
MPPLRSHHLSYSHNTAARIHSKRLEERQAEVGYSAGRGLRGQDSARTGPSIGGGSRSGARDHG